MERCPNCGARCDGSASCRRCGLELAPLLAVEQAAEQLMRDALARLAERDATAALSALGRARTLRREPFGGLLLGFARAEAAGEGLARGTAAADRSATDAAPEYAPRMGRLVDLPDWPLVPPNHPRIEDHTP
ncbi:MAG: hypothetical protein MUC77_06685 [Chromatiaceae bacterium]|jgi:hypothetical protein|nr:hypothetical protein [Chromatiaceae bacterium]